MSRRLLNFDFDGVLVDSKKRNLKYAEQTQRELGVGRPPTESDFEIESLTCKGIGQHIGIPDELSNRFEQRMKELIEADTRPYPLFSRIPEVIRELSTLHTLTIITANTEVAVKRTLSEYGLDSSISLILDETSGSKSERIRKSIDYFIARFGSRPKSIVMIGDAVGDIRAGKEAGVQTVAVTWGYLPKELLQRESPDYIAESLDKLLEILR